MLPRTLAAPLPRSITVGTHGAAFTEETIKAAESFGLPGGRAPRLGLRMATAELHAADLTAALEHRTDIDMALGSIRVAGVPGTPASNLTRVAVPLGGS